MQHFTSLQGARSFLRSVLRPAALAIALSLASFESANAQTSVAFCFGDGTGLIGNCPCGAAQNGGPGSGCMNSTGAGGQMIAVGNSCVTAVCGPDTLQLGGTGLPAGVSALLLQGTVAGSPGSFLGDGIRCVGGNLFRLYVSQTSTAGNVVFPPAAAMTISARSAAAGDPFGAGAMRHYQIYYRDPAVFCTGSTFNLTNGRSVTWR
jgi:hypothetical protein